MSYKVIASFKDAEDGKREYEVGEPYPREGLEPSEERIAALASSNNKKGYPFIQEVENEPKNEDPEDEFPKNTGSGWYLLSNGEKVQGKEKAIEAENELKGGE